MKTEILYRMIKIQQKIEQLEHNIRKSPDLTEYWMPHLNGLRKNFNKLKSEL